MLHIGIGELSDAARDQKLALKHAAPAFAHCAFGQLPRGARGGRMRHMTGKIDVMIITRQICRIQLRMGFSALKSNMGLNTAHFRAKTKRSLNKRRLLPKHSRRGNTHRLRRRRTLDKGAVDRRATLEPKLNQCRRKRGIARVRLDQSHRTVRQDIKCQARESRFRRSARKVEEDGLVHLP